MRLHLTLYSVAIFSVTNGVVSAFWSYLKKMSLSSLTKILCPANVQRIWDCGRVIWTHVKTYSIYNQFI